MKTNLILQKVAFLHGLIDPSWIDGNPGQPGLVWTPFTAEKCETMVWDNECRMINDPEGDLRKILLQS